MDKITRALFGFCLLILSGSAAAIAITGTINIGGGSKVFTNSTHTSATGLNFNCGASCGGSVNLFPAPTGSFAGLGGLSTMPGGGLTLYNFLFSNIPSQTIWSISSGGMVYSFSLSSVQIVGGNTGNFSTLALTGTGIFSITGGSTAYTPTAGNWIYTQSGASFSSQSAASVPEPGTIALVGLGLIGIGTIRRIRKTA